MLGELKRGYKVGMKRGILVFLMIWCTILIYPFQSEAIGAEVSGTFDEVTSPSRQHYVIDRSELFYPLQSWVTIRGTVNMDNLVHDGTILEIGLFDKWLDDPVIRTIPGWPPMYDSAVAVFMKGAATYSDREIWIPGTGPEWITGLTGNVNFLLTIGVGNETMSLTIGKETRTHFWGLRSDWAIAPSQPPELEQGGYLIAQQYVGTESSTGYSTFYATTVNDPPLDGTTGTQLTITGSGFGSIKGKVLIGGKATKILTWDSSTITCEIKKNLPIGSYDIVVKPKEPKGAAPISIDTPFIMMAPEIVSVDPDRGMSGKNFVVLSGMNLGSKKGKVYLGTKKCKVLTWEMNRATGESTVLFLVPKNMYPGVYDVTVINKVGSATVPYGFTIL
jgi:hypothetical protein